MITDRPNTTITRDESGLDELLRPGQWAPPSPPAPPRASNPRMRWLFLLPLLISAFIGAYFLYQARYDEQFRYYPYKWHANWITTGTKTNKVAFFRKTFTISGPIQSAYIAVTADNAFGLRVNGQRTVPFYVYAENAPDLPGEMSQFSHEGIEPTNYAAFGNLRRASLAHIYLITPFLHPGRNVIAISTLSDDGAPRLAAQAVIRAGGRQEVVTDGTWKVQTIDQQRRGLAWFAPKFFDGDWPDSVDTGEHITVPVDGETQTLEQPMNGWFIGANDPDIHSYPIRLRRTIVCPDHVKVGWLRVSSSVPYSLRLNGEYAGSSTLLDHYRHDFVQRGRDDYETLGRIRNEGNEDATPPVDAISKIDTYMVKNALHSGPNQVELVLNQPLLQQSNAIPQIYLDGSLTFPDGTKQALATDFSWQADSGKGWGPARIASKADAFYTGFSNILMTDLVTSGYDADLRELRNGLILLAVFVLAGWAGARLISVFDGGGRAATWSRMGVLFVAPAVMLTCAALLQAIFAYSMQDQYFSTADYAWLVLEVAGGLWLLTLLVTLLAAWRGKMREANTSRPPVTGIAAWFDRYGFALAIGAVMGVAAAYYSYQITRQSIIPDEYVSMLAARGILRHGEPIFEQSNIVYTRSGLYHNLLAGVLWLTQWLHVDIAYTRLLAAAWQLALIPVAYLFGRELKGRWAGLIAAMLIALSPYQIYLARETRFYTEFAFFATLTCYFMYKSLREPNNDRLKGAVVLAFCGTYMSQELAISMLPPIILLYLLGGQVKQWFKWKNIAWMVVILAMIGIDFREYSLKCVTPLPFIDNDSSPLMALHTGSMDAMSAMLFLNIERTQLAQGVLYFIGLAYAMIRLFRKPAPDAIVRPVGTIGPDGWKWWNYLYLMSGMTVLVVTIIAAHAAGRYTVHMAPLLALTAACVAVQLGEIIYNWVRGAFRAPTAARLVLATFIISLGFVSIAACRPERTWNAMTRTNNRDDTLAMRYVKANWQPGDKIIAFNSETALMELDRCDYHWRPWKQSRAKYFSIDGALRERNSAAYEIDNADKLRQVVTKNPRVWLVVPPRTLRIPDADGPTAMQAFLVANMPVVYQQYNIEVLLWDRSQNHYRNAVHDYRGEMANFE